MQFTDLPAEIVMVAVHKLISTNKFPPTIAEVKAKIQSIHWEAYDVLTTFKEFASEEVRAQYQRIYDATKDYKMGKLYEPTLTQMISSGQPLQIGSGKEGS